MMVYQVNEDIPLTFRKLVGGSPVTGLTVTATVRDVLTGTVLLNAVSLSEVSPGLYTYLWVGGPSAQKNCIVTYAEGNRQYDEFFLVDDFEDDIERRSSIVR